jgi:hypothetical protein
MISRELLFVGSPAEGNDIAHQGFGNHLMLLKNLETGNISILTGFTILSICLVFAVRYGNVSLARRSVPDIALALLIIFILLQMMVFAFLAETRTFYTAAKSSTATLAAMQNRAGQGIGQRVRRVGHPLVRPGNAAHCVQGELRTDFYVHQSPHLSHRQRYHRGVAGAAGHCRLRPEHALPWRFGNFSIVNPKEFFHVPVSP